MPVNTNQYHSIISQLNPQKVQLIAVSKTKPNEDIIELYDLGQRAFGENYVQELVDKAASLPKDIQWHFIGHLQSNKVKYIAPFVHLIHGVDSEKLLEEINKQAIKQKRIIDCLLQVHIATEETKFGFDADSIDEFISYIVIATVSSTMPTWKKKASKSVILGGGITVPQFRILSMSVSVQYWLKLLLLGVR